MVDTLGANSVRFKIDYLLMPGLTIYHDSYAGGAARLQGMPPPDKLVVAVPCDDRQDSVFWSRQVSTGALYSMQSTPLDARMSDGHGNWVAFIDVSDDLPKPLELMVDQLQSCKGREGISGSQNRSQGLVEIMRQLLRAAALADPAQRDAALVALRAEFERRLCYAVQPDGSGRESARSRNKQSRAVTTLLDCIRSEGLGTSSVDQLCKKIQVNYRTLARGVQAEFGCSVYTLLRRQRLHEARRRLLAVAPLSGTTVTEVAFSCAFFDLGRFSAAYRREFGEYPSKTLTTKSNAVQPVLAQP
jgi:AraC family ethanolamine operon transcriptional activator